MKAQNDRKTLIAKIHVGKKQLGLDEATYRDVLTRVTGKDSLKAMDLKELKKVVADMKKHGFVPVPTAATKNEAPAWGKKRHSTEEKQALMNKIEAMLADMNLSWKYADGMAKKMFGVSFVNWLNHRQLYKLTQALAIHQQKQAKQAQNQANQS